MTVIAWDGKTLAADKMSASVGYGHTVTKIYRVPGGLLGLSGDGDTAMLVLEWFKSGRLTDLYPKQMTDKDDGTSAMYITRAGVLCYGKTPAPQRLEDRFTAMGHGRDFALAAMHLGCDARRAVEVACALDVFCGCGIDTLELE